MGRDLNSAHTWASDIGPGQLPSALRFSAPPTGLRVKGKGKVKSKSKQCNATFWLLTLGPFGAAEERRRSGGSPAHMSEAHVFVGRVYAPARFGEHHRAPPQAAATWGVFFFGYFILHKQKKVTRSPQGSETARSRVVRCTHNEEATPWIPAFAGMTIVAVSETDQGRMTGNPLPERLSSRWHIYNRAKIRKSPPIRRTS